MPDSLSPLFDFDSGTLALMFVRLVLAMVLGLAIAWVYRRARPANGEAESFGVTLVLLTILIAMVTQVIGDNVARAFSLVGPCRSCGSGPSCATHRTQPTSSSPSQSAWQSVQIIRRSRSADWRSLASPR